MLYYQLSATERGTFYNIKQIFNHRNAKRNINASFNHSSDLLEFAIKGYFCLLAMKLMKTCAQNEVPKNYTGHVVP